MTTLLLGADWTELRWRAGAALSYSWGNGLYDGNDDLTDGAIKTTLWGLLPYGRYALTPRLGIGPPLAMDGVMCPSSLKRATGRPTPSP